MNQPYVTLILIPEFWRHSLVIFQRNAKTPEKKKCLFATSNKEWLFDFFNQYYFNGKENNFPIFANTLLTIVAK